MAGAGGEGELCATDVVAAKVVTATRPALRNLCVLELRGKNSLHPKSGRLSAPTLSSSGTAVDSGSFNATVPDLFTPAPLPSLTSSPLPRFWRLARGLSYDQPCPNYMPACLVLCLFTLAEQGTKGSGCQLTTRNTQRRQSGQRIRTQLNVVKADHGDIAGYRQSLLMNCSHRADGCQIIGPDDRRRQAP